MDADISQAARRQAGYNYGSKTTSSRLWSLLADRRELQRAAGQRREPGDVRRGHSLAAHGPRLRRSSSQDQLPLRLAAIGSSGPAYNNVHRNTTLISPLTAGLLNVIKVVPEVIESKCF